MEAIRYRKVDHSDLFTLKHIRDNVRENALVSLRIDLEDYERAMFKDGTGWVCEVDGKVVGFVCGRLVQGDIWALFLDAKFEGRGIGNQLMQLIETWMFSQGLDTIVLSTDPGTRAQRLYERRGWKNAGLNEGGELRFSSASALA